MGDHYSILGVARDADAEDIKRAYRGLCVWPSSKPHPVARLARAHSHARP